MASEPPEPGWADEWDDEAATVVLSPEERSAALREALEAQEVESRAVVADADDTPTRAADTSIPTAGDAAHHTPWRSLHPLSLAANLVPQAWRTARAAWPLLLAVVVGGGSMGMETVDLSLLLAFFGLTLFRTLVHFFTLRYRVHNGKFEVRSGLLNRRARVLDPARIQNIERVQNLFHKAVGLVEVRVETAGDASTQGLLSAVSVEEAARLQSALQKLVRGASQGASLAEDDDEVEHLEEEAEGSVLVEGSGLEALAYGLSRRTVGTVAVLTAVFAEVFGRMGPTPADTAWLFRPDVFGPALLLAFAGSWLWSAGRALFKHWRFRLVLQGDRLINEEGLTTRRRVEIPIRKVQLVRADEPPLRRIMGYGSILIETAALGFADGEVRQAEGVVPMVERDTLPVVLQAATPEVVVDPWSVELRPAHWRALWRIEVAMLSRFAFFGALLAYWAGAWGAVALLGLPVVLGLGFLEWRRQGWLVTPEAVVLRRGVLRRSTWVLDRAKIQSLAIAQTPFMRWHGLGRVVVRVAGSAIALPDVALDVALEVFEDLSAGRPPRSEVA